MSDETSQMIHRADTYAPRLRFIDRFSDGEDVFYGEAEENGVRLYRVTGTVDVARALLSHDAVIHDQAIVVPEYTEQYHTVDLLHHMAGRRASIRVDKTLDEPMVTLEEIDRV